MVQCGQQQGFGLLAAVLVIVADVGAEKLDRYVAAQVLIHRAVHGGSAARTDELGGAVSIPKEYIHGCPP
ncbi:hypothetical protein GCM10017708_33850 [Arthrobacter citreus]